MLRSARRLAVSATALALCAATGAAASTTGSPAPAQGAARLTAPTTSKLAAARTAGTSLTPPAPPCPLPALGAVGPCVSVPETPAFGEPVPGNMAYYGGRVQVHPRVYLVYLGWGRPGAFTAACAPRTLSEGTIRATLKCDPDGAGKRMADFVSQLGGTPWAGLQSQYFQVVNGKQTFISNDRNQLGGIWVDDASPTSAKLTYHQMAAEAGRAVAHFHITDLWNSNVVIVQPQKFSDPQAQSVGYCAFHDITNATVDPTDYKGVTQGVVWTNMPYVLNQGSGCGENLVNAGAAGRLDGFTIALGHEIEEAVTDPGAEDRVNGTAIGGWYDPFDGNENGDKCAYVGLLDPTQPGAAANITGNRGGTFPVQSLWSNKAAAGAGFCAGTKYDLGF
ncbi:MAG: hypothetical protein QOD70_219 [Frankiales bacterium]|jgi:serine protease|nr:hypothetical protein [Frankiales bacterium]